MWLMVSIILFFCKKPSVSWLCDIENDNIFLKFVDTILLMISLFFSKESFK